MEIAQNNDKEDSRGKPKVRFFVCNYSKRCDEDAIDMAIYMKGHGSHFIHEYNFTLEDLRVFNASLQCQCSGVEG